jgi:O-antigen/teichoic acid export membrane protein
MNSNEETIAVPLNTHSITSLILGILTILSFCTGWLPVPFTGFLCFPISLLCGLFALVFGIISLNGIRRRNESGRPLAWMGIIIGGFVLLCVLCMLVTIALVFAPGSIHVPPFLEQYQI